jgi:uncharacterized membrane protein YidH (DUF202 family)
MSNASNDSIPRTLLAWNLRTSIIVKATRIVPPQVRYHVALNRKGGTTMGLRTDRKTYTSTSISLAIAASLAVLLAAAAVRAQDVVEKRVETAQGSTSRIEITTLPAVKTNAAVSRHRMASQHRSTRSHPSDWNETVEEHTTVEDLVPLVEDVIVVDEPPAVVQRRTTVETVIPSQPIVEEHVVETIEDE